MSADLAVRTACPDELPRLFEIDGAASVLFEQAGVVVALEPDHPFVLDELARWTAAIERSETWVVDDTSGLPQAFAVAGTVDGLPYLDQVSVHPAFMRRGLGARLIATVRAWAAARGDALWLTTYEHLPFNRPYYERLGFERAGPEGAELRAILDAQRDALPFPERRVAMRLRLR